MKAKKNPAGKNRRDIGQVISPIEKMMAAREMSSSCVGVEALLEIDARQIRDTGTSRRPESRLVVERRKLPGRLNFPRVT